MSYSTNISTKTNSKIVDKFLKYFYKFHIFIALSPIYINGRNAVKSVFPPFFKLYTFALCSMTVVIELFLTISITRTKDNHLINTVNKLVTITMSMASSSAWIIACLFGESYGRESLTNYDLIERFSAMKDKSKYVKGLFKSMVPIHVVSIVVTAGLSVFDPKAKGGMLQYSWGSFSVLVTDLIVLKYVYEIVISTRLLKDVNYLLVRYVSFDNQVIK